MGTPSSATLEPLMRIAKLWWEHERPVNYKIEQHLKNPTINCVTEAERVLAEEIAKMVKLGW